MLRCGVHSLIAPLIKCPCDPVIIICRKGQLDVRELISLYPLLLPASSSFTRCHPPLHEFADLNHLAQGDQEKVLRCKKFLISYLGEVKTDFCSKFTLSEVPLVIL